MHRLQPCLRSSRGFLQGRAELADVHRGGCMLAERLQASRGLVACGIHVAPQALLCRREPQLRGELLGATALERTEAGTQLRHVLLGPCDAAAELPGLAGCCRQVAVHLRARHHLALDAGQARLEAAAALLQPSLQCALRGAQVALGAEAFLVGSGRRNTLGGQPPQLPVDATKLPLPQLLVAGGERRFHIRGHELSDYVADSVELLLQKQAVEERLHNTDNLPNSGIRQILDDDVHTAQVLGLCRGHTLCQSKLQVSVVKQLLSAGFVGDHGQEVVHISCPRCLVLGLCSCLMRCGEPVSGSRRGHLLHRNSKFARLGPCLGYI
mmetsp:Transcript_90610/g.251977  ORF Transcript_90610/g.251977 Transcript_90610/m.251977 type:complete len:325 (-) Transcript_90610:522-1496(-)